MFGIFFKTFKTATRTVDWEAPDHWKIRKYPQSRDEIARHDREAKLRAMRITGMW